MTAHVSTAERSPQWWRVSLWLLPHYGKLMLWFWAVMVVAAVAILAVVGSAVRVQLSAMQMAHHGALWFPFSIAIIVTTSYLTVHVANGLTRRSFAATMLIMCVAVGVFNAVANVTGLVVEGWVYDRLGWLQGQVDNGGETEVLVGGTWAYLLGLALLFTSGMLSGALVGITYYRWGAWVGTLALPLTLSPIALMSLVGLSAQDQWRPWDVALLELGITHLLAALVVLVLAAAAFVLAARRIPIAPKEA